MSINKRDNMRLLRLAILMTGVVVSAVVGSFAGQRALAEPVEPVTQEAANNPSEICYAETFSASGDSSCPMRERETDETAQERAYLIATASPGYTMTRQGPERAIGLLHPAFVHRLAAAIAEARAAGLPFTGIFSAYRPPAFGVGGFIDKFHSLHTYGLAVDITGIGGPGTPSALLWHEIAARHGVICPYGPHNPIEWNHCQPTQVKIIVSESALRETVTADGPIDLEGMFKVGSSLIADSGSTGGPTAAPPALFFKSRQARTARAVESGSLPRLQLHSTRQWPLGPYCSLVIDQRSTLLPLTDGFRKNTRPYLEPISLSLSTRLLGRRIGIGSALRRTVAELLKRYVRSFVRLAEAACCSGSDSYFMVLETLIRPPSRPTGLLL